MFNWTETGPCALHMPTVHAAGFDPEVTEEKQYRKEERKKNLDVQMYETLRAADLST